MYTSIDDKELNEYLEIAIKDTHTELEWLYGSNPNHNRLDRDNFIRVLKAMKSKYNFISEENVLDVRPQFLSKKGPVISNLRISIKGIQDIKSYCKNNNLNDIVNKEYILKGFYYNRYKRDKKYISLKNDEYDFRINLKKERNISENHDQVMKIKESWDTSLKYFRYKKRYSFVTNDNMFRIDLTAVKSNDYNRKKKQLNFYRNLQDARLFNQRENYEIEIEYIGSTKLNDIYPIYSLIGTSFNLCDDSLTFIVPLLKVLFLKIGIQTFKKFCLFG